MKKTIGLGVGVLTLVLGCSLDTMGTATGSAGGSVDAGAGTGGTIDASWPDSSGGGTGGTGAGGTSGGSSGASGTGGTIADASPESAADVGPEAGVEVDCTNGVDDDNDGAADCADTDCEPITMCVPKVPADWTGPLVAAFRGGTEPAGDCGSLAEGPSFMSGMVAPAAACSCRCGNATGGTCMSPLATLHADATCQSPILAAFASEGCSVVHIIGSTQFGGVMAKRPVLTVAGNCVPYANEQVEPLSWSEAVTTCEPQAIGTGCGGNAVCIAKPPASLTETCYARAGDQPCPAELPEKHVMYEGADDDRGCSAGSCACTGATGQVCRGTVRLHTGDSCGHTIRSFDLDDQCHPLNLGTELVRSVELVTGNPTGGQCTAVGTASTVGSATPHGAHTICCLE